MIATKAVGNGDYVDLWIVDDDIAFDENGAAITLDGRACIAQDAVHAIRESGLLAGLVGERDHEKRQAVYVAVTLLVEADYRLIPGTVKITEDTATVGKLWITAQTYDYHEIGFWL